MGAGEDYLSVNAFNCLDPEGVSTKILSSPPVFLVPVYRFAVLGISLWHGTHDEQTLACIVLGGCTLVALRLRCGGRSGVTNFCPISGENRASTGGCFYLATVLDSGGAGRAGR
jgi:hypothetical protein